MKSKLLGWVFHEGRYCGPGETVTFTAEQYDSLAKFGMCELCEPEPEASQPEAVAAAGLKPEPEQEFKPAMPPMPTMQTMRPLDGNRRNK